MATVPTDVLPAEAVPVKSERKADRERANIGNVIQVEPEDQDLGGMIFVVQAVTEVAVRGVVYVPSERGPRAHYVSGVRHGHYVVIGSIRWSPSGGL